MDQGVLVAMSGGVDSSVAAWVLLQNGYTCSGAMMRLCDVALTGSPHCTKDAQQVCQRLQIPFFDLDAADYFERNVVGDFIAAYECGLTPNPCVVCNRTVKFGLFLEQALAKGFSHIATGHYARIREEHGRYLLYKAADPAKDQSYFLAGLSQHQLRHTLFPLGELTKEQVRSFAADLGFDNAQKKDSQDICFVPDGDYMAFLRRYTGKDYAAGNFLDLQGNVVGRHSGAVGYTLGQRKGLGLAMGAPVYVCQKDMAANTVTVGPNEALFSQKLVARDWNWIAFDAPTAPFTCSAKARSRHIEQPVTVYPGKDGSFCVVFDQPQRALTPGQAVVLYQEDLVLGSGTITQVGD